MGEYKLIEVDYSLSGKLQIPRYLVVRKVVSDLFYDQILKHLCQFWVLIGLIINQRVFHREYLLQLARRSHNNQVNGSDVDTFEAMVSEGYDIETQVDPLVPSESCDGDAGMQRVRDYDILVSTTMEDETSLCLYGNSLRQGYLGRVCDAHLNVQIFTKRDLDLEDKKRLDQTQEIFVFLRHLDLSLTIQSVYVTFDVLIEHF